MRIFKIVLLTILGLLIVDGLLLFGVFNAAADVPHWTITERFMAAVRDSSISRGAHGVQEPASLDDPAMIASGAGEYAEMCVDCHLAPGEADSEASRGLYPKPPNLAKHGGDRSAAEQFWIVKHGLKMTGMPAWGLTHDDTRLWSMVAFVRKLPRLSPQEYSRLAASEEHEHAGAAHSDDEAAAPAQQSR